MAKKTKTVLKGFLEAENAENFKDPEMEEYWKRVKNNVFILGDPEEEQIIFLNREFTKIAKSYEGQYVKITIEPATFVPKEQRGLPDVNNMYEGHEKIKRTLFNIFKIS